MRLLVLREGPLVAACLGRPGTRSLLDLAELGDVEQAPPQLQLARWLFRTVRIRCVQQVQPHPLGVLLQLTGQVVGVEARQVAQEVVLRKIVVVQHLYAHLLLQAVHEQVVEPIVPRWVQVALDCARAILAVADGDLHKWIRCAPHDACVARGQTLSFHDLDLQHGDGERRLDGDQRLEGHVLPGLHHEAVGQHERLRQDLHDRPLEELKHHATEEGGSQIFHAADCQRQVGRVEEEDLLRAKAGPVRNQRAEDDRHGARHLHTLDGEPRRGQRHAARSGALYRGLHHEGLGRELDVEVQLEGLEVKLGVVASLCPHRFHLRRPLAGVVFHVERRDLHLVRPLADLHQHPLEHLRLGLRLDGLPHVRPHDLCHLVHPLQLALASLCSPLPPGRRDGAPTEAAVAAGGALRVAQRRLGPVEHGPPRLRPGLRLARFRQAFRVRAR
mmetsp:Transcript_66555/g.171276  ORF Transcript_66555/g.171276 Transcript_66555/m.171276 type:complete len:444 (+) Transcript_66555:1110-2441(+)